MLSPDGVPYLLIETVDRVIPTHGPGEAGFSFRAFPAYQDLQTHVLSLRSKFREPDMISGTNQFVETFYIPCFDVSVR